MNSKTKNILLLIFLIILLISINYNFINKFLEKSLLDYEFVEVDRVIDGDTVVINETSFRLLGVNSPEQGESFYEPAKDFLEKLILNETVRVEKRGVDKYYRELAYVFVYSKNVNVEMVENGFANFYFPSAKDEYYNDFVKAWEKCIDENINLCEESVDVCVECILLKELNIEEQFVVFENNCDYDCDLDGWEIKDEGRKNFIFENFVLENKDEIKITTEDFNKDYVWTETGDTLFLRDGGGKLVLWESY